MFKTLYSRLAVALILLIIILSCVYTWISLRAGEQFYQEMTQRLNQQLAANLIIDTKLSVADGQYDESSLESVFHTYMVINPSIEVYLLDPAGKILAYQAPPGTVKSEHLDLAPIQSFLRGDPAFPILGDDPRHPDRKDIFSVAPVGDADQPEGYLYIVLAGEQLQAIAHRLQQSHIIRFALYAIAISTFLAMLFGLLVLRYQTRRLRSLSSDISNFKSGNTETIENLNTEEPVITDDIGHLQQTFQGMATRITTQIEELQQTDNLRRELVANVSHDLRTPLAALQGYLETLLVKSETLTDDQHREFLQQAYRQSQGLGKLVDALFELAKLDSGQIQLKREQFSLGELAQDVGLKHSLKAQELGISVKTSIADNLPSVDADIGLIERVLDNLMDNALRHTPKGGEIEMLLDKQDSGVSVNVKDSGSGISETDLPFIYDRFYQSREGTDSNQGGAGLGLAICKRILELHASQIVVNSIPNQGTSVQFTLPVT
jgi:signal transduction histidine kinase